MTISESFPPYIEINNPESWDACLTQLRKEATIAIDLEANSLFAYHEQICLIQISTPTADYIIDPTADIDLSPLGELINNPEIEKIFHAVEYDLILMNREFGWTINNLFDTMWAARILGYPKVGLANLLNQFFAVTLNKKYQRTNWCRRPLSPEQLLYAQNDTHYLFQLRAILASELKDKGCWEESIEIFADQTKIDTSPLSYNPDQFWSMNGTRHLRGNDLSVLKALHQYRDQLASDQNQPPFKILGNKTLIDLAEIKPIFTQELYGIFGLSPRQIKKYGHGLVTTIKASRKNPVPVKPTIVRPTRIVRKRTQLLQNWRKETAQTRNVESDVILSRAMMHELAQKNPQSIAEFNQLELMGPWRKKTYAAPLLQLLADK